MPLKSIYINNCKVCCEDRIPKLSFVQPGPGALLFKEHLYTSPVWCWPFVSNGAPTNNLKRKTQLYFEDKCLIIEI